MNPKLREPLAIALLALMIVSIALAQQMSAPADQQAPAVPMSQWPQRLDSPDGLITLYQPQPAKFEGDTLTARAAVSLTPPGATEPEFGALWFTARVSTDRDARAVTIQNITIKQVKLPNSSPDAEARFGKVLEQQVPAMNLMLSLDQLESTLGVVQKAKEEAKQLDNTPPKIVFTTTPTTLVLLDGPPKLQQADPPGVMTVVNTPFIMLFDGNSKRWFLKAGEFWMTAPDVLGPWTAAVGSDVPAGIVEAGSKLTDNSSPQAAPQAGLPQILVAEEPTEVISTQGPPTYTPVAGNDLLYMSNTQSDVFMEVASQQYYVLLSGRWFMSHSLQGPWAFVGSDKLPASFAQIPPDSPKANVLASIAGTQQARDARLDAFVPQTTAIRRDAGASLNVAYDGDPKFVPVQNTPITYASNCEDPVLDVDNAYYCCHQAVWYQSPAPIGPWTVCVSVPQVIYTLPPSCPIYYCRYVYVYDSTPDVAYCGYLQGYTGCYVYDGTVVYGTGYRYPYWYHTRFIPRPCTWGFGACYDYYAGTWGFGLSFSYGSNWFANRPERHHWFGPQGYVDYREVHSRYDRATGSQTNARNISVTRINLYNRQENVRRNMPVRNESHVPVEPRNQPVKRELPLTENNVYAGQDGSVYRRTQTGWETHDAKGWSQVKTLPEVHPELKPNEHAEKIPQHVEEPRQPAVNNQPREIPAREPARVERPERVEQPSLDEERAARERPAFNPGANQVHSAPPEQHGGGGAAQGSGGASQGGGGGGGAAGAGGSGGRQK